MAEWQAFEQAFGPLDESYERNALAAMAETLELANYMTGAQLEENPFSLPKHYPRPTELWQPKDVPEPVDPEEVSQAEFDKEFD